MRRLVLGLGVALAATLGAHSTANATSIPAHIQIDAASPGPSVHEVYWVWRGRHWHHRRYVARVYRYGRWRPGYYVYY